MQSASGPTATVVQVSQKTHGTAPTVIQQNGQNIIVGKLANSARPATTNTDLSTLHAVHSTNSQTVYPAQYIETIAEQTVYAANGGENGHVGFLGLKSGTPLRKLFSSVTKSIPGQYQTYGPIIYAPVSTGQTYYQTTTGQVLASTFTGSTGPGIPGVGPGIHTAAIGAGHAQLVTHQGATYLVQSGQLEEDASAISHTAKASPVTVQWLVENYETAEGVSLPRSTLYFHYLQHCNEHKLEPMNPASFGKLIRSVFFGLRTRRLGTRGNSKYHYYGIRIKPTSHLNHFVEDAGFSLRHYPNYHRQTMEAAADWKNFTSSPMNRSRSIIGPTNTGLSSTQHSSLQSMAVQHNEFGCSSSRSDKPPSYLSSTNTVGSGGTLMSTVVDNSVPLSGTVSSPTLNTSSQHQHAQFLGEASSALPNLDEICRSAGLPVPGETDLASLTSENTNSGKSKTKPGGTTASLDPSFCADLITFCRLYALSASYMLDAVVNLDFTAIETVWKAFWRTEEVRDSRLRQSLSQERLHTLVCDPAVLQFVRLYDHTFYQSLAEVLIPNVLRPIPHALTQAIRNFAKSLEGWMRQATHGLDSTLVALKISAVSALAQTLRRYTSLNHLAQAARTVLKNTSQINQMLTDLNRVDFNNVQEQASWVCQCSDATVSQLEQDFKRILHKHASLEEWAQWLDTVVINILQPLEGNSLAYTRAAHQLILKWSFYSSMVIRDLTLRSAASFGSFHLIRLLYDEYIFYLVEHKVAAHLGMTPVAVMGEMGRHLTQQNYSQNRLYSDLIGRCDTTTTGNAADDYDTLNYVSSDEFPVGENHYLPLGGMNPPKSSTNTSNPNEDDDEEVDEYLDDEEDVDDSTGDESAMLKHAHASVQAYCRSTSATGKPLEPVLLFDPAETGLRPDQPTDSKIGDSEATSETSLPIVTESDNTAVSKECTPVEHSPSRSEPCAAESTDVQDESSSAGLQTPLDEPSCSPPPLPVAPNPTRKVVRVTTFCDPVQPSSENLQPNDIATSNESDSVAGHTQASPTERPPSSLLVHDKPILPDLNPSKRVRMSQS